MNVWSFSFLVLIFFFFCTNQASLEIVAGGSHNCVYEPGQTGMMCWGLNNAGQLGYEDTNNRGDDAGEMSGNLPIVNLGPNFSVNTTSLGGLHSCAASKEHAVKCWGWGDYYQTGHATTNHLGDDAGEMGANLAFVEFRAGFLPLKIAAGYWHSCVLSTDALLVCFGHNEYGQCGAGTSDTYIIGPPSNIAVVDLGSNFTPIEISGFFEHVCAISQQQSIKCFGRNDNGQLGYGDTTDRGLTPQLMGDGLPVLSLGSNFAPKAVAVGGYHTCALSTLKTVKCFGWNVYGQCGQVTPGGGNEIVFPDGFVPVQMALGGYHTCILSESGQVACFGYNGDGQLGLGHTSDTTSPTLVHLGTGFTPRKITAGNYHTCAVSTIDTVKCWGKNGDGQLGLGHANNMGDQANEMGDDLPIVDLQYTAATAPTTAAPTTDEPTTTEAPTSAAPTTAAPTTASPTTAAPTTATPTTPAPTTASPTTAAPTTAEATGAPPAAPTTAATAPTTEAPTSAAPTTATPSTPAPTTATPTTTAPTTAAPTTDEPTGAPTAAPTTATPTTATTESETTHAPNNSSNSNHTVAVTTRTDSLSSTLKDMQGDDEDDDAQAPRATAWSWGIPVIVSLDVCVCVCCVAAAIRCICVHRQRSKQAAVPTLPPPPPPPRAAPAPAAALALASVLSHSLPRVVVSGAVDHNERKQGEEDVELEMAPIKKQAKAFVYDPDRNYKPEGARASLVTPGINRNVAVVEEEKSDSEEVYVGNNDNNNNNDTNNTTGNSDDEDIYIVKDTKTRTANSTKTRTTKKTKTRKTKRRTMKTSANTPTNDREPSLALCQENRTAHL